MNLDTFVQAMGGGLSRDRYAALLPAFEAAMREADITTVRRAAMWCAQLGHESGGLRWMEEIADGGAYEGRRDLGNTQPGDGRRFKGRGPIQITGRHNYTKVSEWAHGRGLVPTPTFFVDDPAALGDDRYGFLGPVWYWTAARPNLNALSDAGDLPGATRAINGGLYGIDDRLIRYRRCLDLGEALLPTTQEAPMTTADEIKAQLTGSPEPGQYPGWPSFVKPDVSFTLVDYVRLIDAATHRAEKRLESIEAKLDALIAKGGK